MYPLTQSPFVSPPSRRTPKYEQKVKAFSIGRLLSRTVGRIETQRLRAAIWPPPGSVARGCLRSERNQVTQRGQPRQSLAFELPDALARQVELVADRLERPGLALESEAELEDAPLALGQRVQRAADALPPE